MTDAARLQLGDLIRRRAWEPPAPRHYTALVFSITEIREREHGRQYVAEAGNLVAIIDDDQLPEWQRLVVAD
jgi:hypothetical protein